jgi:uncharacterized membrane protein
MSEKETERPAGGSSEPRGSRPDPDQFEPGIDELRQGARFEATPLTRPEYLGVMTHFYRAEVHRSTIWRVRLDATTNWAALTAAGIVSWAFAEPNHSHVMLLLTNLIVFIYMLIEARRYRRFEVYWARVRMLEENFISPVVTREVKSPRGHWSQEIARDMHEPTYKSTLGAAIGFRLRRNYGYIFGIILGAWLVKLGMHPRVAESWADIWERVAIGNIPAWGVVLAGIVFYSILVAIWLQGRNIHGAQAPVDEITGVEEHPERWKF